MLAGHCGYQERRVTSRSCSVQHGIQLVSQGIKHGADVIQNVLGGGRCGALSLLGAYALLSRLQCGCQGRAGLLQSLLGPARTHRPSALRPRRGYRAGAEPGSQLWARKCQLHTGHRHRLRSCSCSGNFEEGSRGSWRLRLHIQPAACCQSWPGRGPLVAGGLRFGAEIWGWSSLRRKAARLRPWRVRGS